ncbi:hypothetical protein MKY41_18010 [Sporosarcina sp. FSL W7-1349]|uniref:hypothetical protein n=1 Tax=Sporosarcina sp. FSL W7-1349 TaxID=2921561 RepID=UPI0030F4EEFB
MKKKSVKGNKEKNEKQLRIIFRFLLIPVVLVFIGTILITWNRSATDLYNAFVINFIGITFVYAAALVLCSFFLYLSFVITIYNPQKIKKSSVIKFAIGGIFTLLIAIFLLVFSGNETKKSIQDMRDYANGEWQVKELVVRDVYRGPRRSKNVLIETDEGEMILHGKSFRIYKGQPYRFTYLDATNTIIKVENIIE